MQKRITAELLTQQQRLERLKVELEAFGRNQTSKWVAKNKEIAECENQIKYLEQKIKET